MEPLCFRRQGLSPWVTLLMSACSLPRPPSLLTQQLHRHKGRSTTIILTWRMIRWVGVVLQSRFIVGAVCFFQCAGTRSIADGCFQAHRLDVMNTHTSFTTQNHLWDLTRRSGLFPSWPWTFAPKVWLHTIVASAFRVVLTAVRLWAPLCEKLLYLRLHSVCALPQ